MIANKNLGLMFSISPAKKPTKKSDKDEERYMLILAPFNKAPKINFGQVKLNDTVEKSLIVVNPQDFSLKLNIKNTDLNIDNLEVEIERQANIDFKIKWQPEKPDNYKFSIIFEVLNSRLKFIVHAFGVCVEPPKKKVYKNLTILQPIRPTVLKPTQQSIEATLNSKHLSLPAKQKTATNANNKENQQNTFIKKTTVIKAQQAIETTYLIENTVEQFEKILEHVKEEKIETHHKTVYDLQRRQTEIIKTPKLNTHFSFDFNPTEHESSAANGSFNGSYSASVSNLNEVPAAHVLQTPIFKDPGKQLRRSVSVTNINTLSTMCENQQLEFNDDMALSMTPKIKLEFIDHDNKFDDSLEKFDAEDEMHESLVLDFKRKYAAIKIQKAFKKHLHEKEIKKQTFCENIRRKYAVIKIQRLCRGYLKHLTELRIAQEKETQKQLFCDAFRRKYAAIRIQKAYREYKAHLIELAIEKEVQKQVFCEQIRCKYAAIKIQRLCRDYLNRRRRQNQAATIIQQHWKKYLKHRREITAVNTIKRYWNAYKFRKSLNYYRNAATKIQRWTRSMKERYNYLRFKRVVIYIQHIYKQRYRIRTIAALRIQRFYHSYKFRLYEREREEQRVNYAATLIQALWRGYRVRKDINLVQLSNTNERSSIYVSRTQLAIHHTLGYRIKRSLNVLEQKSPSIQQVITALMDLQVVTRLSKECCIQFANSGAISILYDFITRCNRSTPHMDLIKLCLEILINLSKCEHTCEFVIDLEQHQLSDNSALSILLGLLHAYQLSNPQIFMTVCVLIIILASNERLERLREAMLQNNYLKKLQILHSALERRNNIRLKNQRQTVMPANASNHEILNETLNSTLSSTTTNSNTNGANATSNIQFSVEPDWSLSKKLYIQLAEPLGSLQYLLEKALKVKLESSSDSATTYKTPKKGLPSTSLTPSIKKVKHSSTSTIETQAPSSAKKVASSVHKSACVKSLNNTHSKPASSLKTINSAIKSSSASNASKTTSSTVKNVAKTTAKSSVSSLKETKTEDETTEHNRKASTTIRKKLI